MAFFATYSESSTDTRAIGLRLKGCKQLKIWSHILHCLLQKHKCLILYVEFLTLFCSSVVNKKAEPSTRLENVVNEGRELINKSPVKKTLSQSQGSKKSSQNSRNQSQRSSKELKEVPIKDDVILIPSDSPKGLAPPILSHISAMHSNWTYSTYSFSTFQALLKLQPK